MSNTMEDLREEVATRLRDTLHGRVIDTINEGMPEMVHMLGIVPVGAISTPQVESGTILDPSHTFWESYESEINTKNGVRQEIRTAIKSLKRDGTFRVTEPYGEDGKEFYIEVDRLNGSDDAFTVPCAKCGATISTEPSLLMNYGEYSLNFELDCPKCEFEKKATSLLHLHP